jgi:hypothetical protein
MAQQRLNHGMLAMHTDNFAETRQMAALHVFFASGAPNS